ncbi:TNT antitoxin family protein [Mycobacterium intracellulare]|uniref:TNT antitoxin family protein n=1 Tax=Mycobacterium intracellulare TaxID=1767 RepID=UPI001EED5C3F|nr:TNT antitoxin family protein [Mycobacterium intracellulare]MEE3754344.1 TNT antitoxin family protein [Mycobacterium intracellulare]
MMGGIGASQRLEQWAKLADYALTSGSNTPDGRPVFWSALGENRLFIGRKQDGWLVITDSDRMESEGFVLAAPSLDVIEKYLFGRFGTYIRSARSLPRVGVPMPANEVCSNFSIETREYEGVERFALIAPDGSTVAIGSADKITATAELKKLALYLSATIDQIESSTIDPDGKPLFERR